MIGGQMIVLNVYYKCKPDTVRYYERVRVIPEVTRTGNYGMKLRKRTGR